MKIVLNRVDERLIHGQVMTSWLGSTGVQRIAIVDDELYSDEFMKQVLVLAAPSNIKIKVLNIDKFKELMDKHVDDKEAIVLFKQPKYVLEALKKGIKLNEVIVGNMGPSAEREKVTKNVYLSPKEREVLNEIDELSCKVYLQMLPHDEKKPFK